ncbi:nucleocapsid protein [Wufeng Niviventer niviventer orthohantavirus 1]|uniref:Nucleoprotein n=4 Tax=Hantaviridae TaxID=1980413 RepID=I1TMI8_9VIRU|nr:nucleoprotein [Dabieshan virus]QFG71805.1 nucleoprotein [Orthohantavirus dabieshanense]UBB42255.1 nucleocapsid protein [Longquan Niviventer fulvescens orthohantavirus 1]UBB42261.1 nucleocapsid protein [Longquan Niviventer niviventer orthohantavirus 1]UBB42264.1 nucleocapsid protein [Wufeng Niviventer niviventer orthohantavirus 1]UBB42267.1 nucleocapsid protein [Wufeng Niviventer fulvescens orthohantavirus 1]WEU70804.1 MAG: nucleocapsid protein [Hantaviridae sp.]
MATMEELQKEINAHEGQLIIAKQKVKDAEKQYEKDPDELNKRALTDREGVAASIQAKIDELKRQLADRIATGKNLGQDRDPTGVEPGDHLKERSMLSYGNILDLNHLDIDEPTGQTADWLSIIVYLTSFVVPILLKALYMLTTRGRQTAKDNKGTRIRFKDDSSFEDVNGIRKPKHLYVSMPNAQSSMKAEEITPGRYRTAVCGLFPAQIKARQMVSPVMSVIGFMALAKDWTDRIESWLGEPCKLLPDTSAVSLLGGPATNRDYIRQRQVALGNMETKEAKAVRQHAESAGCSMIDNIDSPSSIWVFAGAPDRCPPTCLFIAGIAELGAFFSILQDMRNTIMASKTVGTSEEKMRKKSSFYQSYLRRTQSMGIQLDQRIIVLFMVAWGKEAVDNFHLGDDMDPELRTLAQSLIDQKVKEISNQEPLKL